MTDPKQPIAVNFVEYEQYEHFPNHVQTLGYVSVADALKLMDIFANPRQSAFLGLIQNSPKLQELLQHDNVAPNACIKTLSMQFNDQVHFGNIPGAGNRYRSLDIDGLFYLDTNPQCATKTNTRKWTDKKKLLCCARNLRTGKCTDEFIKNTLGAILYPQHYGKQK
ncbi:MAG: hypothetical protein IJD41_00930 [Alphaproteobacteria bacterium]|nr:hypothetical protein [Alphaproteobacteria bacterium]MBQ7127770.1 hypothetical protein [Alphaproteobacteria bacterium]